MYYDDLSFDDFPMDAYGDETLGLLAEDDFGPDDFDLGDDLDFDSDYGDFEEDFDDFDDSDDDYDPFEDEEYDDFYEDDLEDY